MVLCKYFCHTSFRLPVFVINSNSFIDHFVFSCDFVNMIMCNNLRVFDDNVQGKVNLSDHCAIANTLTCCLQRA